MPGGRSKAAPSAKSEQRRLIYGTSGNVPAPGQNVWDPKTELFAAAVMCLISDGCGVSFSSAGGGRMIGITIFEGDVKHPRKWIYDDEELDAWAESIIDAHKAAEAEE